MVSRALCAIANGLAREQQPATEANPAALAMTDPNRGETPESDSNSSQAEPTPAATSDEGATPPTGWARILARVRNRLPAALNRVLPDWGLTGILVGAFVALVWLGLSVARGEPGQPPPQPEAPAQAQAAAEPPETEPTPEQAFVAAVRERITELTERETSDLVQAIRPDLASSTVTVTLADRWYELEPQRQDRLANKLQRRAQALDFSWVRAVDAEGRLLARSPNLGSDMLVLARERRS
ncbi:MAG: hypothetical protein BRC58_03240 [Cyanobacteria bacterium QS_8_64_29]|nr:MAG: hypothetical protein BRC58_03240 [Cyanobacteria bacterium QS_8_64_29]